MMHKHAYLMLQYANDAQETDNPIGRWQHRCSVSGEWLNFINNYSPTWDPNREYRRIPDHIYVNGIKIIAPVIRSLPVGDLYYIPDFNGEYYSQQSWDEEELDFFYLSLGIVHLNPENAIAHAEAMLVYKRD